MFNGLGGSIERAHPNFDSIDPTLDACCQREEESNRRREALQITLQRYDRIAMAERRRRYVTSDFSFGSGCRCCYDPKMDGGEYTALAEARLKLDEEHHQLLTEDEPPKERRSVDGTRPQEDVDSDDEYDYLLEEDDNNENIQKMEEERRVEMYLEALTIESAVHHGFATHRQIHPQHIVRATGLGKKETTSGYSGGYSSPAVVLHLFDDMSPLSASLDLFLEKMAPRYKGTQFIRCDARMSFI